MNTIRLSKFAIFFMISSSYAYASEPQVRDAHTEEVARKTALNAALLQEAKKGDLKRVKELLEQGADLDTRDAHGNSALHNAAKN